MKEKHKLAVDQFDVCLEGLVVPMGLKLDTVHIRGKSLTIQSHPFEATAPEPGAMEVTCSAANIAAFLEKESPAGLRDFKVGLRDGKMYISAVKNMIVDIKANAVCSLKVVDGTKLFVELESVDAMGVGAKGLVQSQLERINPVLDTADLPLEATISEVETDNDCLIVRGTVAPPR